MFPEGFLAEVLAGSGPKGPIEEVARVAGILAAKRTGDLIPMCHPLGLDFVEILFESAPDHPDQLLIRCTARCEGPTGVEMEAMTGASVAGPHRLRHDEGGLEGDPNQRRSPPEQERRKNREFGALAERFLAVFGRNGVLTRGSGRPDWLGSAADPGGELPGTFPAPQAQDPRLKPWTPNSSGASPES